MFPTGIVVGATAAGISVILAIAVMSIAIIILRAAVARKRARCKAEQKPAPEHVYQQEDIEFTHNAAYNTMKMIHHVAIESYGTATPPLVDPGNLYASLIVEGEAMTESTPVESSSVVYDYIDPRDM